MSEQHHDPRDDPDGASQSEQQPSPLPDDSMEGANHRARNAPDSPQAEHPKDHKRTEPHSSQETPVEPMQPQRIPPLPRSQFTRYLLDYIGGGHYQLSIQGKGEGIIPFAKADSPAPLIAIANETSLPGDEFIVAPAVALVDIACMTTGTIRLLQSRGHDPFARIGTALGKRVKNPAEETMRGREVAGATGAGDGRDSSESAAPPGGGRTTQGRVNGVDPSELAPELRHLLERDRRTGGRLGWIFEMNAAANGGDADEKDGGDRPPRLDDRERD